MTVFNTKQVDTTDSPMFFGEPLGIQQYTSFKYPIFEKLTETQLGFFWKPEEVSLQKDRSDYQLLRPEHKHIFTSNLKRQVMLDSVQGRGPALAFLPHVSLPELESAMTVWGMMEMIHSRSYTHIIKNLYSQPEEVFGTILTDTNILETATAVTAGYDDFINSEADKRKLFRAVMNVNILEGVRFYVSFACTFAFGENKLMEGSAKILSFIARDENQHLVLTQNIINKWADGSEGPEWKRIYEEEINNSRRMFETCVNDEKAWASYLFKDGSMIGLSEPLLVRYVEWIANRRMKAIGLKPLYDIPAKNNPLPWTDNWLKSRGVQVAPQETENESYLIGKIKQDMSENSFSGFEL
jgi:ribonucleoside-diphosphate reductase beta chain